MDEKIKELSLAIKNAKNIVIFSGAGISTESGIKDFRSKDGLYNLKSKYGVPYEVILSHTYYEYHTETFYKFYREFMIKDDVKPNFGHYFLSDLENKYHKNVTIMTQNIDGLHSEADSKNVIELHGSIYRNYCTKCAKFYSLNDIKNMDNVPKCECGGIIKPDVVLYEEGLLESNITKAIIALEKADLLLIVGTSLAVYPAASFISYFYGDNIYIINKEHIDTRRKIKYEFNDSIGDIFKKVDDYLKENGF